MKVWLPTIQVKTGTDTYTMRLAKALRRRGIDAEITWYNKYFELAPFMLRSVAPPPGTTIIHTNSWNGFAFKRRDIPLVTVEHLYVHDALYRPYKTLAQDLYHQTLVKAYEHATFRMADVILAVSKFAARKIRDGKFSNKTSVIYNWIDTNKFTPAPEPHENKTGPFRLLFLGNLSRRKGADLLWPIMKQLNTGFELHYTGDRRLKHERATNMKHLGHLNEAGVIEECQKCDALLFPSRLEGFGYAALEAMACGKPVIATNSSSLPEIVENNKCGILCKPDDIGEFVTACRTIAGSTDLRNKMGNAARARAIENFSEETIINQYLRLFERENHYDRHS